MVFKKRGKKEEKKERKKERKKKKKKTRRGEADIDVIGDLLVAVVVRLSGIGWEKGKSAPVFGNQHRLREMCTRDKCSTPSNKPACEQGYEQTGM
jgi:hypothetical protein